MLKYSTEKPSTEGFYFVKCTGIITGRQYETVVRLYKSNANLPRPDVAFWDGENVSIHNENFIAFAGPIEKPTD